MTTTTIISPSPTRLSFPTPSQHHLPPRPYPMEKVGEKFPSFEDSRSEEKLHPFLSPQEISSPVNSLPVNNWPVRRSSQTGWENRNGGGLYKHRPKRSVTEAFDNFRQRRGSISANTQELAEALKAPVSYKLIVRASFLLYC
jgi:solute carrier family 35, member E1